MKICMQRSRCSIRVRNEARGGGANIEALAYSLAMWADDTHWNGEHCAAANSALRHACRFERVVEHVSFTPITGLLVGNRFLRICPAVNQHGASGKSHPCARAYATTRRASASGIIFPLRTVPIRPALKLSSRF